MGKLSGGERNRLHLAKLLRTGGNLLLLDEPTNDLDVDTLRALEEALLAFAGCAVVVSHDRWFLDRIATHVIAFEGDSQVRWFEGNFEAYESFRHEQLGADADRPAPDHLQEARPGMSASASRRVSPRMGAGATRRASSGAVPRATAGRRRTAVPPGGGGVGRGERGDAVREQALRRAARCGVRGAGISRRSHDRSGRPAAGAAARTASRPGGAPSGSIQFALAGLSGDDIKHDLPVAAVTRPVSESAQSR